MFFPIIIGMTIIFQILIVQFGSYGFRTVPISGGMWLASVVLGFISLPLGVSIRLLPSWTGLELERESPGKRAAEPTVTVRSSRIITEIENSNRVG
jgi:hypothetical protein